VIIDLGREELESLVRGGDPYYSVFENPLVKQHGSYCGGFVEKWSWNSDFSDLSEEKLYELYNICKDSWN